MTLYQKRRTAKTPTRQKHVPGPFRPPAVGTGKRNADSQRSSRQQCLFVCLLVVSSVITWRGGVYFSGGLDPIVAAKALLGISAMVLALSTLLAKQNKPVRLGHTLFFFSAYLVLAILGAVASGDTLASFVLSFRLFILSVTLIALVLTYTAETVLTDFCRALAIVLSVAVVSGVPSLTEGRLRGGLPPLHPNELALMAGLILILLAWRWVHVGLLGRHIAGAILLAATMWLTGSRTGLAALLVAVALVILLTKFRRPGVAVAISIAAPILAGIILLTDSATDYIDRGGSENVGTLSARTIAWSAAWNYPRTDWARWLGSGLAQKKIPVQGQFWDTQGLDSSWVSALVQVGLIGVVVIILWMLAVLALSYRSAAPARSLLLPLSAFLILRSFLESGLFDSSVAFCAWMIVSIATEQYGPRTVNSLNSGKTQHDLYPATTSPGEVVEGRTQSVSA